MAPVDRLLQPRVLLVPSIVHSVLYTGLMVCAFFLGKPQPATFVFGLSHGIMYPLMGLVAIVAARRGAVGWTAAIVVAVMGALCPYFGTFDLWREGRRRDGAEATAGSA